MRRPIDRLAEFLLPLLHVAVQLDDHVMLIHLPFNRDRAELGPIDSGFHGVPPAHTSLSTRAVDWRSARRTAFPCSPYQPASSRTSSRSAGRGSAPAHTCVPARARLLLLRVRETTPRRHARCRNADAIAVERSLLISHAPLAT